MQKRLKNTDLDNRLMTKFVVGCARNKSNIWRKDACHWDKHV